MENVLAVWSSVSSTLAVGAKLAFFPSDVNQMTVFYLIWIGLFFSVNTIWDILTDKTPSFHIAMMKDKMDVLYGASTFCSSLLILIGLASPEVGKLSKDTILPLVLAGGAGLLRGLPALCPYKPDFERKPVADIQNIQALGMVPPAQKAPPAAP